jgi:hypothetical protein
MTMHGCLGSKNFRFCRVGCGLSGRCLSSTGALWDECEPVRGLRAQVLQEILAAPWRCDAVSGEHGIGTAEQKYFLELADPSPWT